MIMKKSILVFTVLLSSFVYNSQTVYAEALRTDLKGKPLALRNFAINQISMPSSYPLYNLGSFTFDPAAKQPTNIWNLLGQNARLSALLSTTNKTFLKPSIKDNASLYPTVTIIHKKTAVTEYILFQLEQGELSYFAKINMQVVPNYMKYARTEMKWMQYPAYYLYPINLEINNGEIHITKFDIGFIAPYNTMLKNWGILVEGPGKYSE